MKQNHTAPETGYRRITGKVRELRASLSIVLLIVASSLYAQQTYTFTPCGATGRLGPSVSQVTLAYSTTNLNGKVTSAGGIQSFTVPHTGNYKIKVAGAKGGDGRNGSTATPGGLGAIVQAELSLTGGQVLQIVAGHVGMPSTVTADTGGGGGGGSYVASGSTPLIIAGGGGSGADNAVGGSNATTSTSGLQGNNAGGLGGTNGNGGAIWNTSTSGGGGGFTTNGATAAGGSAFLNGANGGTGTFGDGGFGGGGGGNDSSNDNGAGGGGYSGGGVGGSNAAGAGGGSFIASTGVSLASSDGLYNGTPVQNLAAFNPGPGYVTIEELCSITLSVAGVNANGAMCAGSSVTITTNAVSNYLWSTGNPGPFLIESPTSNTVYALTATSPSNCNASSHVSITVNPLPTFNVNSSSPVVCLGSTAVLMASGADTYSWSTNSTATNVTVLPLQSTTYSVTGTNTLTGCSLTKPVIVDVFTPTVSISGNSVICKGGTATLSAFANGAISYSWSTGLPISTILVSPLNNNIYVATAIVPTLNIACVAVNSIQVNVNDVPNIVAIANRLTMCVDETVELSATGGTAYAWSWGSQTSNSPTFSVTPFVMTTMIANVTGTASNGCVNTDAVTVQVMSCTGINEAGLSSDRIRVYPNPSQGEISVAFGMPIELMLINETGQLVRKLSLNDENDYKADVSGLSSGIYFITGQSNTRRISEKIVITR